MVHRGLKRIRKMQICLLDRGKATVLGCLKCHTEGREGRMRRRYQSPSEVQASLLELLVAGYRSSMKCIIPQFSQIQSEITADVEASQNFQQLVKVNHTY